MTSTELKNKIKQIINQVYNKPDLDQQPPLPGNDIPVPQETFPILSQFPSFKETIVKLLTSQYEDFIKDIEWVAPRPTTFRIVLKNDEMFYLIYSKKSWTAQVEGKKYYLSNVGEEGRGAESISRLLYFGVAEPEKIEPKEPEDEEPIEPEK